MTGVEIEMVGLRKTPCIDAALALIEETRSCLGVGEPVTGRRFQEEERKFRAMEQVTLRPYEALWRLAQGNEAWWIAANARLYPLICCVNRTYLLLSHIIKCINDHVGIISCCRNAMDHIIGGLQSERGWVEKLFLEDLPAARVADTEFANAAMVKHRELVSELRSSTTPLVVGSEGSWAVGSRGINGVCVELETFLAGVRGSGNPLTAFSPATGSVSMPTAQLLSASTALSDYAMELEAIKCGPEFLAEVENTHGLLAAEDFISALSRFVELHNLLLAELSAEVRLVAEDMGNAARSYRDTDAMAAALIA